MTEPRQAGSFYALSVRLLADAFPEWSADEVARAAAEVAVAPRTELLTPPGLVLSDPLSVGGDRLLTPGEVAALFRVDPKTITRWAAAGRLGSIRTPGGHRRFLESTVRALLEGDGIVEEIRADDAVHRDLP